MKNLVFNFVVDGFSKITGRFSVANYQPSAKQGGYSLVEVLVAITVLLIALVGPLTIAHSGLKRSSFSKEQTQAVFLAQEGIEAIVKIREDNALSAASYANLAQVWGNMTAMAARCPIGGATKCGVAIQESGAVAQGNVYQCSGANCAIRYYDGARVPFRQGAGGGTATDYTRELTMTITNAFARVRSEVYWSAEPADRITLETYIYNIYYEAP